MAARSSFADPRQSGGIAKDFRGERRWLAEGPGGGRAPLLRRLFGMTEWSKEERNRSKVAITEFRQQLRDFETRRHREDYEWQKRGFPEFKKKVYYKWGVESARQAAQQDNPYYEQQYKMKLEYAEKELKKFTDQRVKDRQKERYTTLHELETGLQEKRKLHRTQMSEEWHSANNQGQT